MEQRLCYGCMEFTDQPVCPHCGWSAEQNNKSHQLPVGAYLAGRYQVGRALRQSPAGILYLGLDITPAGQQFSGWNTTPTRTVNLLEYYPRQDARRNGSNVEPAGESSARRFAEGKAQFNRITQLLAGEKELAEVFGVREGFEENGTVYRVIEQVRGTTLDRYVRLRGGPLSAEETLRILGPVLRAAAAAHRAGAAHGGIRMDSIVLDPMGGARLQGFGENPAATAQQDVLDLCRVILGCLMEGAEGLSACPDQVPGLAPRQLAALKTGMEQDPRNRFASAGALCTALLDAGQQVPGQQSVGGGSAGGPAVPPAPRPKKSRKKLWIGIGAAAGALVLVFLALLVFGVHIWTDADCTKPQTCVLCGKTEGRALGHDWQEATCETPRICDRCGETQGTALGHAWQEATCLAPRTCDRCGEVQGSASGHSWQDATCTEPKTCKYCGETQGAALGHDWAEATYTTPSTCRRCGETRGSVRGYHESVSGTYERFYSTKVNGWCLKLDEPVLGCRKFTLVVEVSNISYGTPVGSWKAFYRNTKGEWINLGNFNMTGTTGSATFTFNTPVDIDSVTAVYDGGGSFTFSVGFAMTEVYAAD